MITFVIHGAIVTKYRQVFGNWSELENRRGYICFHLVDMKQRLESSNVNHTVRGRQLRCISTWSYRRNVGNVIRKYNYSGRSDFGNEGSKYSMLLWIPYAHRIGILNISYLDTWLRYRFEFSLYKFIKLKDICITAKVSEFLIYGWMFVKGGKDYEKGCSTVTFHIPNKTINSYADSL